MKNLIIDTDIGGDPDDLIALLLALKSPEVNIKLIITSDEHKGHRVSFAKKILAKFNKNIPVVFGSDLNNNRCCVVCEEVEESESQEFIPIFKNIISKNEEIYYLCIGPQTNLAKVIEEIPEAREKLKIYIMGGNLSKRSIGKSEHNIRYDIKAAQKVVNSGWDQKWITAEITFDERLSIKPNNKFHKKILSQPRLSILAKNIELFWNKLYPKSYLHDPIALSSIISKEVIQFTPMNIIVNEEGILKESKLGNKINISTSFNVEQFLNILETIFEDD